MGRRIFIDLSDKEEADIGGWVKMGLANPQFAQNPWKLVLHERTYARFRQVAEQFGAFTPPAPVDPTDPLGRVRAAPSQWAKNLDGTMTETERAAAVKAGYWTEEDSHRIANWWHDNGCKGYYDRATGEYFYFTLDANGNEVKHKDTGGADAATVDICGKPIPGPALP